MAFLTSRSEKRNKAADEAIGAGNLTNSKTKQKTSDQVTNQYPSRYRISSGTARPAPTSSADFSGSLCRRGAWEDGAGDNSWVMRLLRAPASDGRSKQLYCRHVTLGLAGSEVAPTWSGHVVAGVVAIGQWVPAPLSLCFLCSVGIRVDSIGRGWLPKRQKSWRGSLADLDLFAVSARVLVCPCS